MWEGVTNWVSIGPDYIWYGNPSGLSNNSNLAAGFLALGIVYLLTTPLKWLSVPLLVALLFTGSRWGVAIALAVIVAMAITRSISWRPLVGAAVVIVAAVLFLGAFTPKGYALAGINSFAGVANAVTADVGSRLAVPHLPTFLPSGVAEHPGLHNVPLRIAVENGLIAAGLWVLITGWALWPRVHNNVNHHGTTYDRDAPDNDHETINNVHRWLLFPVRYLFFKFKHDTHERPDHDRSDQGQHTEQIHQLPPVESVGVPVHRWLLLTLVLLSVLDYYTWMGHLGGFWWLLIGLLTKGR